MRHPDAMEAHDVDFCLVQMVREFAFYYGKNSKHSYNNLCDMNYATVIAAEIVK